MRAAAAALLRKQSDARTPHLKLERRTALRPWRRTRVMPSRLITSRAARFTRFSGQVARV